MDKQTAFTVPMLAPPTDDVDGGAGIRASYTVEQADPARHGQALRLLIERMYGWRGLNLVESAMPTGRPDRITLVASENGEVCGTMTLGLDDEQGLLAAVGDQLGPDIPHIVLQRLHSRVVQGDDPALGPLRRERGRLLSAGPQRFGHRLHRFTSQWGKFPEFPQQSLFF